MLAQAALGHTVRNTQYRIATLQRLRGSYHGYRTHYT
jgi:hypothetical protein